MYKIKNWMDINKLDLIDLSENPFGLDLLEKNSNKINWNILSSNPNALHILEKI
jgi:hypothetical protein